MQSYTARVASFAGISKPKSQAKPAWPFSPSAAPLLTAERMAEAGFYHSPSPEAGDEACLCYLCGMQLASWENDDDPYAEHARRGNCAWAEMYCAVKVDRGKPEGLAYDTPAALPKSALSAKVRLQTFGKWWPHKGKGVLPTAKKVAEAGFVYFPEKNSEDQVTCVHCGYTLDGWDLDDDPYEIHLKKAPHCNFFTAQVQDPLSAASSVRPSSLSAPRADGQSKIKSTKATTKRSKKAKDAAAESHSEAEHHVEKDEEATEEPAALSKSTRRGRKPKARDSAVTTVSAVPTEPKSKSTSGRGRKKKVVEEEPAPEGVTEDEVAEEQEDEAMPEAAKADEEDEQEEAPKKKGRGRPKGAATAKDKAEKAPPKPRGRPRKKPVAEAPEETSEETDGEAEEEEVVAEAEEEQDDTIIAPPPPVETASKSSKATKSSKSTKGTGATRPPEEPQPASTEAQRTYTLSDPSDPSSQSSRPAGLAKANPRGAGSRAEKEKPPAPSPEPSPPPIPAKAPGRSKRSSAVPKSAPAPRPPLKAATSELDRFANLPPTSPAFLDPGVTPKASGSASAPSRRPAHVSTKPSKPSPRTALAPEVLDGSLTSGAKEARKVMDDLILNSPWKPQDPEEEEKEMRMELTDEQRGMTLTDLVSQTMAARKEMLRKEGLAMIGAWEAKTREARRRLEGL